MLTQRDKAKRTFQFHLKYNLTQLTRSFLKKSICGILYNSYIKHPLTQGWIHTHVSQIYNHVRELYATITQNNKSKKSYSSCLIRYFILLENFTFLNIIKVIAKSLIFYFLETNIHTQERENEILTQIDHKSVSKHTKLTLIPSSLCYCGDMVTMANYNPLSFYFIIFKHYFLSK